jgi:hypothetical protein
MPATYYYIDLNLKTGKYIEIGTSPYASHTGDTSEKNVHRVFLTKGQFNKLKEKLETVSKL